MKTIKIFYVFLCVIFMVCISVYSCCAQATLIRIDSLEREKVAQWTLQNTFPDIIIFVKDSLRQYIVGTEVLLDRAYEKTGIFENQRVESLWSFLRVKCDTIENKPRDRLVK